MTTSTDSHFSLKRVYLPANDADGKRVLVDRLWPRGVTKREAHVDLWLKDVAPSPALRKWFGHDPARFDEFRTRYKRELQDRAAQLDELRDLAKHGHVTLLYGAHDETHNQAVVLAEILAGSAKGRHA
jgi:uncharacterized protein YeaO (DUF488 family)